MTSSWIQYFFSPSSWLWGIFFIMDNYDYATEHVSWSASMKISFGNWSGPKLFFRFSFFIAASISLFVIGSFSGPGSLHFFWNSFIIFVIISVDAWHSVVQGLAWYRSSKYLAMCSFVSSCSVSSFPSFKVKVYESPNNQGALHFWSEFGDFSLNGWRVVAQTNS